MAKEYIAIEKAVNIASVNYGFNHNQARGFRNDLKRASSANVREDEPVAVRCRNDCYWVRDDLGDFYTPPSSECGKDFSVFKDSNIEP